MNDNEEPCLDIAGDLAAIKQALEEAGAKIVPIFQKSMGSGSGHLMAATFVQAFAFELAVRDCCASDEDLRNVMLAGYEEAVEAYFNDGE